MLPRAMMAVRLFEYGDASVLRCVEVPLPDVGPDEVLVRVRATSVTRWDLRYRQGLLTAPPGCAPLPLPFQLGREAAGIVEAAGGEVRDFKPGDRVVAMTCPACGRCEYCRRGLDNLCVDVGLPGHQRFGGYAEYVCRKESELLHAPENVPFEKLACLLNVGGEMLPLCLKCLRMDGTLVSAGQHGGRFCNVDVELLYRRHLNVLGTRGATRHEQQEVVSLAAEGRIDPVLSHVLPLAQAAEAHRVLEREEQMGKIVLLP